MNFKTALKTAALATALAFATASHAETQDAYSHEFNDGGLIVDQAGKVLNQNSLFADPAQGIAVYDMTNLGNAAQSFLAFCIAPTVDLVGGANYFATYNVSLTDKFGLTRGNNIKALYETSFSLLDTTESKLAFQLALWDLEVDDGKIDLTTGHQYFTIQADPSDPIELASDPIYLAQRMLSSAEVYLINGGTLNTYSYTTFNTLDGAPLSQELMGASIAAVPEADTWAMLVAGLGLVGFVGRRRAKQSEKFAA